MIDALRSYFQLAAGLAEVSAAKAKEAAATLASQGPDTTPSSEALTNGLQNIAEDLVEQSRTNTDIIVGIVKSEVDRAVGRMGFVREEELAAVRRHVRRLELELTSRSGQAADAALTAATVGAKSAAATAKTAAGAAASAARTAPKLVSKSQTATPPVAGVRTTQPKKANARKPAAKKSPAKKASTKKTASKKTSASTSAKAK